MKIDNFNKVCRACLTTKESFNYNFFDNVDSEIFTFCTSIVVFKDDLLPKSVCSMCYELLVKFTQFKHKCFESQNILSSVTVKHNKNGENVKCEPSEATSNRETEGQSPDGNVKLNQVKLEVDPANDDSDTADKEDANECNTFDNIADVPIIIQYSIKKRPRKKKINAIKKQKALKRPFLFNCTVCNKKFRIPERFKMHLLEHEGENPSIHCGPCNKTFLSWGGLQRHNESEHTPASEKYKCSICNNVYKNRSTLSTHMYSHGKKLMCDICGKDFRTNVTLKRHLETHKEHRSRDFACEHCGREFYSGSLLSTHVSRRHRGRRYVCHLCSFPFADKHNLRKHMYAHQGIKPFKCDVCQNSYSSRGFLLEHKRIHSGEKPYPCGVCDKAFISKRRLKDHHLTHTGERPHKCTVCALAFTQRGSLKRHIVKLHRNDASLVTIS